MAVLTQPHLMQCIFAYQPSALSMALALTFRRLKAALAQNPALVVADGAPFRGYVLCKLVEAEHTQLALELLRCFPAPYELRLPAIPDPSVYAIDNAVRTQNVELLRRLLERGFGKSSTAAMDTAAANGSMIALQLLHEYRSDGCTKAAFKAASKRRHIHVLAFLRRHRPLDENVRPQRPGSFLPPELARAVGSSSMMPQTSDTTQALCVVQ
ncbi:hypothetical protein SPRG_03480 [Saprolegnia parasitica CBS 223.65]|uniref:Uncharacterized protein n=1 Tax=Saprolegnia parasitica (strain CBS 223.65) TaxID=695850 RepID=A0A067CYD6_SAPPC|nr:hypothetical protein SPRG_03480 [Saprolegnia parasitica CBS 223.65]KDO31551.1 hypothetical protein SPRG_03480 [Saprolegnia parasitica CBS 223.65]|eukprot:XP_012197458.1 hypothetical protein SPRG_03480 [Saprolegnia parasitica CBS 223.65]